MSLISSNPCIAATAPTRALRRHFRALGADLYKQKGVRLAVIRTTVPCVLAAAPVVVVVRRTVVVVVDVVIKDTLTDSRKRGRGRGRAPHGDLCKSNRPRASSPQAICTVLLDPRDPLLRSERTQGFAAGPVYGREK